MLRLQTLACITLIGLGTGLSGCKSVARAIADEIESIKQEREPRPEPGRPATAQEAAEFSRRFEAAVLKPQALRPLLDSEALGERAFGDLKLSNEIVGSAAEGVSKNFFGSLERTLRGGGSCKLLAARMVDGERRAKFRLLEPGGGFNYHDYVLVNRQGKVRAADVHVLHTAELLSATMRRTLLPIAIEADRGLIDRLTKKEGTYVRHLDDINKLGQFETDPAGALEVYTRLPDELKQDKTVLIIRVQAAAMVNDEQLYLAALEDYRRAFPDDPSAQVVSIDYYFMKRQFEQALKAVHALERETGPDAHLNVMRASIHTELEQWEAARAEIAKALQREPDLTQAVNLGIALDLGVGDEQAALEKLAQARRLKVDLSQVEQNPDFIILKATEQAKAAELRGGAEASVRRPSLGAGPLDSPGSAK